MTDLVTMQIIRNRIGTLMEEMDHNIFRSGYSTIVRESHDFSVIVTDHEGRLLIAPRMFLHSFTYYHFVVPHRSLRQRLPHSLPTKGRNGSRKKWKPVTPAMAAGLTDRVWTMDELLSFRVPPKHLWC